VDLQGKKNLDNESIKLILSLLTVPLNELGLNVLNMSYFPIMMDYLELNKKRKIAKRVLSSIIKIRGKITSRAVLSKLLAFIPTLTDTATVDQNSTVLA